MTLPCLRIIRVHIVICLVEFSKTFRYFFHIIHTYNISSSRPYAPDILQNLFLFWVLIKVSHLLCCLGLGLQPVPSMKYAILGNHRGLKTGKCVMQYSLLFFRKVRNLNLIQTVGNPDMFKITVFLKTTCHSPEWAWLLLSIVWSMYVLPGPPSTSHIFLIQFS